MSLNPPSAKPTYRSWFNAKRRCRDPRTRAYPTYGGRGIEFDPRWDRYEDFLRDMGVCPEGLSLDRINNDGPYSPENCRWATPTEQQRNTRKTVILEFKGRTRPMAELAAEHSIDRRIVNLRIKAGWSIERALTQTPIKKPRKVQA